MAYQAPADFDAAVAVARFAHTYDAPHALRHVEAYLTAFMDARFKIFVWHALTGKTSGENLLKLAVMSDEYSMHELRGHCERAMTMFWNDYQDRPKPGWPAEQQRAPAHCQGAEHVSDGCIKQGFSMST